MTIFEDVVGESEENGTIPACTKSYTAADIDFLLKKKVECVSELPTATKSNLGVVLLLTDSQPGYSVMHFYKCVLNGDNYTWRDLNARLPCGNCTNINALRMDGGATCAIKWNDPVVAAVSTGDYVTVDQWDHTVLVRNYDHEPTGINDGVVVVTCGVRNQYAETPFLDTSVDATKEHVYYKLIPIGVGGTENVDSANAVEPSAPTWDDLHKLIQAGLAPAFLPKGSQISVQHSVYGTLKFTVKGYEDLGAESTDPTAKINIHDSSIQHCVVLMSTYILPGTKQFDAAETQYGLTLDTEFQSDKTYYISDGGTGYTAATVTVGDPVPADTYYELNPNTSYYTNGSNKWNLSGMRQWLNSEGSAGTWWSKKHANDVKPNYADTEDGFLKGFTDYDFVRRIIYLDNVTEIATPYGGGTVTTVDKIWLPRLEQVNNSGTWGYLANGDRKMFREGATTSAIWWLRSPHVSYSGGERAIGSNGNISYYNAFEVTRGGVVPCLAIA